MLGRIESKIDTLVTGAEKADARMDEHEDRLGKLERGRAYGLGFAAAISAAFSAAGAFLFHGSA